jgi:hypothetical protein
MVWFLAFITLASCTLLDIESQIHKLTKDLSDMQLARQIVLESSGKPSPQALSPISSDDETWRLHRIIPKYRIPYKTSYGQPVAIDFVTLKPIVSFRDSNFSTVTNGNNLGIAIVYEHGIFELYDNTNELLFKHNITYTPTFFAASNNYDGICYLDIKLAFISPTSKLQVFSIWMDRLKVNATNTIEEFGVQTQKVNITMKFESEDNLFTESRPSSMIYYVRMGKKYWMVGDEIGGLSLHHLNGTLVKRTEIGNEPVAAMDRFGQQLVVSTGTRAAVVNGNLAVQQYCEGTHDRIIDLAIDLTTSTSIIHALLANGDIIQFDARFDTSCRGNISSVINKISNKHSPLKLLTAKNIVAVWTSSGLLSIYDPAESHPHEQNLSISSSGLRFFSAGRLQSGGSIIAVATSEEVYLYDITHPTPSSSGFEFSNMRFVL